MHAEVLLLVLAIPSNTPATTYRSAHFVVEAPGEEAARRIAAEAERKLKDLAIAWLGRELPDWSEPCPVTVTLGAQASRGCTTFVFGDSGIARQEMHLEGTLDRILDGVLPHEMTHVVLAHYFGRPIPRWADEGGASLSEGKVEEARYHDQVRRLLAAPDRQIPLRELFDLARYPHDLFAFYTSGHSVSSYLVGLKGRRTFLSFVALGMGGDWDGAVRRYYGFESVEDLEQAWLASARRAGRREPLPLPTAVRADRQEGTSAARAGSR